MKAFQIGEKVTFLHEHGTGVVKGFRSAHVVIIEDETGFERFFPLTELVKIHSTEFELGFNPEKFKLAKESHTKATVYEREERSYGNSLSAKFWEIDLHIEELVDSHRGMTNAEILRHQMSEFRSFFARAIHHRIPRLIIIHGVGEGVLKDEVRLFLAKKDHLEYFDAPYTHYGKGATEIRLSQKIFE